MATETKSMWDRIKENPLTEFAVGAGSATIVMTVCWAVVKIVSMLFAA